MYFESGQVRWIYSIAGAIIVVNFKALLRIALALRRQTPICPRSSLDTSRGAEGAGVAVTGPTILNSSMSAMEVLSKMSRGY
jgi:hypothetical protein